MELGILQTGKIAAELTEKHGEYPGMFERLLAPALPGWRFRSYAVVDGELPPSPDACDAWLITGSRHGVYDDLPWIEPLKAFLRAARAAGRPIIGVCFGHQILAEAFGGRAEKSDRGWGVGVHDYEVLRRPGWMADAPARIAFQALHQDQVTEAPEDATLLARSGFCPVGMLAYGDPERPEAISIQLHPEFDAEVAGDILRARRGAAIPPEATDPALETIERPVDAARFAGWVARYLEAVGAASPAA
jgi:GMP synthase-like glutamine amidotransferase